MIEYKPITIIKTFRTTLWQKDIDVDELPNNPWNNLDLHYEDHLYCNCLEQLHEFMIEFNKEQKCITNFILYMIEEVQVSRWEKNKIEEYGIIWGKDLKYHPKTAVVLKNTITEYPKSKVILL